MSDFQRVLKLAQEARQADLDMMAQIGSDGMADSEVVFRRWDARDLFQEAVEPQLFITLAEAYGVLSQIRLLGAAREADAIGRVTIHNGYAFVQALMDAGEIHDRLSAEEGN